MRSSINYTTDILVIGSGIAGLSLAIRLANHCKIVVLSKSNIEECSTFYAQGGIAVVLNQNDSVDYHIRDTLISGAGICNQEIVKFVTSNAKHCVYWLIEQGVTFDLEDYDKDSNYYHLNREGGHSYRRILHVSDATGKKIENALINKAILHSNVQILEHRNVIDLIVSNSNKSNYYRRIIGAYVWNCTTNSIELYRARAFVLATGGASAVYKHSTNPSISSGDGIAIAWRAGCRVANMEFNQFHPTCLFHPNARNFLLTEALRGEGAYLCRPDGSRFMSGFDRRAELAPRDVISRAVDHEMKRLGSNCMYLDISYKPDTFIRQKFPNIYNKLLTLNIDLTRQPVPIVPAAHYTCGGVIVDNKGRTDIDGLYAIGEVSYTGLHGANRLASNSLLECLVYGWSAAEDIVHKLPSTTQICEIPSFNYVNRINCYNTKSSLKYSRQTIQTIMWDYAGIIRTTKQLEQALISIKVLKKEIDGYYSNFFISNDLLELRNLVQVAELIIKSALQRKESRGLHFILDYPNKQFGSNPTILEP